MCEIAGPCNRVVESKGALPTASDANCEDQLGLGRIADSAVAAEGNVRKRAETKSAVLVHTSNSTNKHTHTVHEYHMQRQTTYNHTAFTCRDANHKAFMLPHETLKSRQSDQTTDKLARKTTNTSHLKCVRPPFNRKLCILSQGASAITARREPRSEHRLNTNMITANLQAE